MDDRKPTQSTLRRFYNEHLAFAVGYALLSAVLASVLGLLMTWAGYRGKFQPWGDPIPFTEALVNVPTISVVTFVVVFIGFVVFRIRF